MGDLLAFVVKVVGDERFSPGHLAISAGLSNARLWKNSTPWATLWNYLDIASLRSGTVVTLGGHRKEGNEEKEYFAMAAVTVLPEWVHSPETQNPRGTEELNACCLPHEPLK